MQPLLKLLGLQVHFVQAHGKRIHAVNGAFLEVRPGEVVGILGESGSGKSTIAKALLGLLSNSARVAAETMEFDGRDLLQLGERKMQSVRGAGISMIPQDPGQALNPVIKVGDQIAEVIRAHRDWSPKRCRQEAEVLLQRVHLTSTSRRFYDAYPHQLSGGQQQRIVIAQALSCQPALVVADEPTASLDSTSEQEVLDVFRELKREKQMSVLLVTHDPRILTGLADRVAVVYSGRIVETGSLDQIFGQPRHPYTRGLLACAGPETERLPAEARLPTIEGSAPDAEFLPTGCSFAPRCSRRLDACEARHPSAVELENEQRVECFLYGG
jgi:oligopeptide/dipeptide ABC transporter ATP-binding protein